jgi:hypothetical protein
MLAGLGGTMRMRAYRMDEHAGHALAVWRPFNTCLERHSRIHVMLTEISCGGSWRPDDVEGGCWYATGWAERTMERIRVSTWESEEKASFRGRSDWVLSARSGDDW